MTKNDAQKKLDNLVLFHWNKMATLFPIMRKLVVPKVIVNTRTFRTAGSAIIEDNTLSFSLKLYSIYQNEFAKQIVPHEIAHIVADNININNPTTRHHCDIWKSIMIKYGLKPDIYHSMEYRK